MVKNHIVTLCIVPDRESGERIGRTLVEERLAACVNLTPGVLSVYRWQGAVRQETECQMFIKTTAARFDALAARLRALHPYDVPEILALPVVRGDPTYLDWLTENTK